MYGWPGHTTQVAKDKFMTYELSNCQLFRGTERFREKACKSFVIVLNFSCGKHACMLAVSTSMPYSRRRVVGGIIFEDLMGIHATLATWEKHSI